MASKESNARTNPIHNPYRITAGGKMFAGRTALRLGVKTAAELTLIYRNKGLALPAWLLNPDLPARELTLNKRRRPVHPRVARAIRTAAHRGSPRSGGTRTTKPRPKQDIPFDPQALIEAWDAQTDAETGEVLCAINGHPMLDDSKHWRHPHYAEPDRKRPELGYVRGNVQWVQKQYNEWKSDAPLEALVLIGHNAEAILQDESHAELHVRQSA